jgi:hypothetical protein
VVCVSQTTWYFGLWDTDRGEALKVDPRIFLPRGLCPTGHFKSISVCETQTEETDVNQLNVFRKIKNPTSESPMHQLFQKAAWGDEFANSHHLASLP